jgi:hypothetical protein
MNKIDNITADPNQTTKLVLADGSIVVLSLVYFPSIQRWMASIIYGTFQVNNINVSVNPNFMREWRNIIPFGLACFTTDGIDPVYLEDFQDEKASLYLLDEADVLDIEATVLGVGI